MMMMRRKICAFLRTCWCCCVLAAVQKEEWWYYAYAILQELLRGSGNLYSIALIQSMHTPLDYATSHRQVIWVHWHWWMEKFFANSDGQFEGFPPPLFKSHWFQYHTSLQNRSRMALRVILKVPLSLFFNIPPHKLETRESRAGSGDTKSQDRFTRAK